MMGNSQEYKTNIIFLNGESFVPFFVNQIMLTRNIVVLFSWQASFLCHPFGNDGDTSVWDPKFTIIYILQGFNF